MLVGLVAFLSFVGCGSTEAPPPPTPVPAPPPAPPPPPPAPAEPMMMQVDALGAAHAANAGKPVKVQGYYNSMTKQGDKINVELTSAADLTGAKAVCVVDAAKEADVAALAQKSQVTVDGTLSADKAGDAEKIDACTIEPGAVPPPDEGKAGKAKAGGEGKAGKAGKAKAP